MTLRVDRTARRGARVTTQACLSSKSWEDTFVFASQFGIILVGIWAFAIYSII